MQIDCKRKALKGGVVFCVDGGCHVLCVTVVQCQHGWDVKCRQTEICAVIGSTVEMSCSYRYPPQVQDNNVTVKERFWFRKQSEWIVVDLRSDPEYSGRVEYECENKNCLLRIKDLRESDSAKYRFKFTTNQETGKYSGQPVTLTVTVQTSLEWIELTCQTSCQLSDPPSYIWFKNGEKFAEKKKNYVLLQTFSFPDSYHCAIQQHERFPSPPVASLIFMSPPDAPKPPSVSVSPSGEIVEGSSVTLTCSSDANPAASYSWYKAQQFIQGGVQLVFQSIQSSESGQYSCMAEYDPSGRIIEGHSVTLTCSSDANPAASYSWYREGEDTPEASGQTFTITDSRTEHSGMYYCEAQNRRGRLNSTLHLVIEPGEFFFFF
uniref:B-cell receptor CD22 n=1 Tax=Salarias fasciatus TaxID=181472 RepID=A0A672G0E3_SALFA